VSLMLTLQTRFAKSAGVHTYLIVIFFVIYSKVYSKLVLGGLFV